MAEERSKQRAESIGILVLVIGTLIGINVLAYHFNWGRLDTTSQGTWSLSDASKTTVSELTDELEIIGYFSDELPAQFSSVESYVRDILGEYQAASNGNVRVRFVHPDEDAEKEEANEAGVPLAAFPDIANDRQGVVQGFAGLAFSYLGSTTSIPTVENVEGLEYRITMKIKELVGVKTIVGVVSGHGGPTLEEGLAFLQQGLPSIYELRAVPLTSSVPDDIDALLILAPDVPFEEQELGMLNQYVMGGGSLGVFGAGAQVDLAGQTGPTVATEDMNLAPLLSGWGVGIRNDLVMDCFAGCGRVPVEQRTPFGTMRVPAPYPPMPGVALDEEVRQHPAVFRIPNAQMPFTHSLELTSAGQGVEVTTLAHSTEHSWRETTSIDVTPREQNAWRPNGDGGPFPLMIAIEGTLPSAFPASTAGGIEAASQSPDTARVLVSGSSDYFMWRPEFQPQLPPGQSLNPQQLGQVLGLAMNNIDWLAAESELVALRSKTVDDPQIAIPEILAAEQEYQAAQTAGESAIEDQDQEALDEAQTAVEEAVAAYHSAEEEFDRRKLKYKLANMLGIPFGFALFGFIRWRMRNSRRKNLKL